MKRRLHQFIQDYLSPIPSLMSWWSSRKRPRLTCVDEVNSHNQSTSCQMTSSLSPTSSSSHAPRIKYDVFISFRGSDTRRGFLSHLLEALNRAKIKVFVDYKLREGDELSPALLTAIEQSRIALIIFSEDYASSKWCLKELVKITECMMENGQIVIPIFYEVDPSDVRHQKGCYKKAFAKHENLFKGNTMNVEKWKTALNKVADLSGFHSINFGTEAELIGKVVRAVLTRLNQNHQVKLKDLIGIDKPIADLKPLISCTGSDVRIIGIWGMGGIGKTTIAGALFNILRSKYEACYFLANVRVESKKHGIIQLKNELISILLEEKDLNIDIPDGVPDNILSRLSRTKALIVFDDVDDSDQVTNLIGGHDWLGPGSRIIVTSRDRHVIDKEADVIYKVKPLGRDDSLKLLNLHAFKNGNHLQMDWDELMMKVVEYAKGLPLALKILGAFLRGKNDEELESQFQKLQKMPYPEIQAILRLSYEGLDRIDKSIFLYIACFFNGSERKYEVQALLEACGYSMPIALRNLQDKALIEVSRYENVSMHDLIREMGREIVREQNIERPGERSHLWDLDDTCRVLKRGEGTESIKSINLDMSRVSDLRLNPQPFAGMVNLELLRFSCPYGAHSGVHLPEGLETLPNYLRFLHWDQYPAKSLPVTFKAEYLVELRMPESHVERLWDGALNLPNLKNIDLWASELVELPDLSKASSLKEMNLNHCDNLLSIHPSILCLPHLESLHLEFCGALEEIPDIEAFPSSNRFCCTLPALVLLGCDSLKHLPDSLSKWRSLEVLSLSCKQLDISNLQNILDGLSSLTSLELNHFHNLFELPENISKMSSLRTLSLDHTSITELPENINKLSSLQWLSLDDTSITELPENISKLSSLRHLSLDKTSITELPENISKLSSLRHLSLDETSITELPENISKLSSLRNLSLQKSSIKSLPESIKHLPRLEDLCLSNCKKLQSIPEIPASLYILYANGCTSLERLFTPTRELLEKHIRLMTDMSYGGLYRPNTKFTFDNCPNLDKDALQAVLEYVNHSNNK